MKNEINIEIKLDQKEKIFVAEVTGILNDILHKLEEYKANGFYPFVDHVELPPELENIAETVGKIGGLTL